jgi:hypothetical protein
VLGSIKGNPSGNVSYNSNYGKQYEGFFKNTKIELPYDPATPLLLCSQSKWSLFVEETSSTLPCSLQYYSQQPKRLEIT